MKPIVGMSALVSTIALCASVGSTQEIKIWALVQEGMPIFVEGAISTFIEPHKARGLIYLTADTEIKMVKVDLDIMA